MTKNNFGNARLFLLVLIASSPDLGVLGFNLKPVSQYRTISRPLSRGIESTRVLASVAPTRGDSKLNGGEEDDEIILEFDADEEEDYEIDLSQKEEWMKELHLLAKTSASDTSAVDKAQEIFDKMFEAYVMSEETTMWPAVDVYNLLLETHAYSKSTDGGEEAEKILSRMEDTDNEFIARPNMETYLNVMDAWAMRRNPEKAQGILDRIQERHDEDDGAIGPSVDAYNKLIKAHGIVGNVNEAEEIFRSLLEKEDEDPLKANYKSWVQILKTFASQKDQTERAQSLFREMLKFYRMGEEDYEPKIEAYNALIRALGQKRDGAEEAEAMLFELINRYREGDEDARPNAETFRNVIAAQRGRKTVSGAKIEQLLQIQDGLYMATKSEDLRLDGRLYNLALYTISRSKDSRKALMARRVVDKMLGSGVEADHPTVRSYFNLLSACAYTRGTPEENLAAFQISVEALKEIREELKQDPDSSCFGMFLKACANLMPESRKRDGLVENVFRKCCKDGLVDDFVLSEFERASSEALQLEILGGFLEDDVRLPEEWSRNVEFMDEE